MENPNVWEKSEVTEIYVSLSKSWLLDSEETGSGVPLLHPFDRAVGRIALGHHPGH